MNIPIASNGAVNNGFNIASSTGLRTIKNFTISGTLIPSDIFPADNASAPLIS